MIDPDAIEILEKLALDAHTFEKLIFELTLPPPVLIPVTVPVTVRLLSVVDPFTVRFWPMGTVIPAFAVTNPLADTVLTEIAGVPLKFVAVVAFPVKAPTNVVAVIVCPVTVPVIVRLLNVVDPVTFKFEVKVVLDPTCRKFDALLAPTHTFATLELHKMKSFDSAFGKHPPFVGAISMMPVFSDIYILFVDI